MKNKTREEKIDMIKEHLDRDTGVPYAWGADYPKFGNVFIRPNSHGNGYIANVTAISKTGENVFLSAPWAKDLEQIKLIAVATLESVMYSDEEKKERNK